MPRGVSGPALIAFHMTIVRNGRQDPELDQAAHVGRVDAGALGDHLPGELGHRLISLKRHRCLVTEPASLEPRRHLSLLPPF
jgi:hypothetical protein